MKKEYITLAACVLAALILNGLALVFCEWGEELLAMSHPMLFFATLGFACIEGVMIRVMLAIHVTTQRQLGELRRRESYFGQSR